MRTFHHCLVLLFLLAGAAGGLRAEERQPVRGADELYWTPTLEQAIAMARETGRPIFLMGYSLVGDGSTYTKVDEEFCTGVY